MHLNVRASSSWSGTIKTFYRYFMILYLTRFVRKNKRVGAAVALNVLIVDKIMSEHYYDITYLLFFSVTVVTPKHYYSFLSLIASELLAPIKSSRCHGNPSRQLFGIRLLVYSHSSTCAV